MSQVTPALIEEFESNLYSRSSVATVIRLKMISDLAQLSQTKSLASPDIIQLTVEATI